MLDLDLVPTILKNFRICWHSIKEAEGDDLIMIRQVGSLRKLIYEWFQKIESVTLHLESGLLTVNGEYLFSDQNQEPIVRWFRSLCHERKIFEIRFQEGFEYTDLRRLLEVLNEKPERFRDMTVAPQMMNSANITQILINTPATIEDSFRGGEPLTGIFDTSQVPIAIAEFNEVKAELYLSKEECDNMYRYAKDCLASGSTNQIAKMLTQMHHDLGAPGRIEREKAFSGYQVIVDALIAERKDMALYSVSKSMATELANCVEEPFFVLHLETFWRITSYFRDRNFKPVVFGITVLASAKQARPELSREIDHKLAELMGPAYLETLLTAGRTDPSLRPYLAKLLKKAPAIVDFLLEVLYATEDKHKRKLLLDALRRPGRAIYPDLTRRLKKALEENQPWYVKRNLLTLLSVNPPIAMKVPLLRMIATEQHPRVRNLMERCLFAIDDPACVALGNEMLAGEEESLLLVHLRHVGSGLVTAYIPILRLLAENHSSKEVREHAIAAMGNFEIEPAYEFLRDILAKHWLFGNRWGPNCRIAAVQGLAENPANHEFLKKFSGDPDASVRQAIANSLS